MRIYLTSVLIDDQDKALRFYTDVLGFTKKTDIDLGEARWLTVVSPQAPEGPELLLEPDSHPAARPFKAALVADGIPATSFAVEDVHAEFQRLRGLGVRFTQEAGRHGRRDDGGVRRQLRQPDPDRQGIAAPAAPAGCRPTVLAGPGTPWRPGRWRPRVTRPARRRGSGRRS
jgi:catechol 2,3-dioxygenase-like lactoylglutathione lyase family enzyme